MGFDKSLLKPCPVLRPTPEQFKDPVQYFSSPEVIALGKEYGILRIAPPQGWKPPFSLSPSFKFHTRIQKLSDLGITTRSRRFFTDNLNRFLKMSKRREVKQWTRVADKKVYLYDLYLAVNSLFGECPAFGHITDEEISKLNIKFGVPATSRALLYEYDHLIRPYATFLSENSGNYDFPDSDPEDSMNSCLICRKNHSPTQTLLCDHCNNPYHMKCVVPPLTEIPKGAWYCDRCLVGNGAYGFEERTDIKYTLYEFIEMCKQFESNFYSTYGTPGRMLSLDDIERIFWDLVETENSDIKVKYGADIHNLRPGEISGFPTKDMPLSPYDPNADSASYIDHPWNLTRLPFAKGSLLNYVKSSISGMTIPWIYVGSLLSTFCWHVEDHYTLSANYCHFGNAKKWYGIPSDYASDFEKIMRNSAPDLFKRQPDLLHQLVTLISPSDLVKKGVPCYYADQTENEFVVTFPRVYHAGFNSGFNFNEAVNFTTDTWLDFGEKSIGDYKPIKKENVFDHYQLVESILNAFIGEDEAVGKDRLGLVANCIRSYEAFLARQSRVVNELDKSKFEQAVHKKLAQLHEPITPKAEGRRDEAGLDEEDDELCDVCRTYVSFQYCNINNLSHRFGRNVRQLKANRQRPLKVDKLLTPDASPSQASMDRDSRAERVASSASAQGIEDIMDKKPKLDEFDRLIEEAKRKAGDEEEDGHQRKRRRQSQRIQKKTQSPPVKEETTPPLKLMSPDENMSQMRKVQHNSLFQQLNKYENIKLCLECCTLLLGEKGENAPRGSSLVIERSFTDMNVMLEEAKRKYISLMG